MSESRTRPLTAVLDGLLILLLLIPSVLGSVLYGGVRFWVSGPLIALTFVIAAFLCLRFSFRRDEGQLRIPPALIGFLLIAGYAILMYPHAAVPGEVRLEVLKILSYSATFVALCNLGATEWRWRILLAIPIIVVSLICWYALLQHANGSNLVLIEPRPAQYEMRASGTFFCPNHLAYVISLIVVLGVGLATHRRAGWPLRILAVYASLLALPVLLLTASRSGWIATAIGVSVTLFLLAARKGAKHLVIACVLLPLAIGAAGGGLWTFSKTFKGRVHQAMKGDVRLRMWQDTMDAIQEEPIWGHGPGSFGWVYPHYKRAFWAHQQFPQHAHNEYLNFVLEYGAVGAVLLGGALLIALFRLLWLFWRIRAADHARLIAILLGCLAASSAHAFFDFNLHIFSAVHLLLLIAAAVLGKLYAHRELRTFQVSRGWRIPIGLAGMVLFAGLSIYTGRLTVAYLLMVKAEHARTDELNVDAALDDITRSIELDPGSWRAYDELGRILATRSAFYFDREQRPQIAREAVAAFEKMKEINPLNLRANIELSHLYADQLNDPAKALLLLKEASDYVPKHSEYRVQLGHRLRKMGYPKEALAVYTKAREVKPSDKTIELNIRNLKKELGIK